MSVGNTLPTDLITIGQVLPAILSETSHQAVNLPAVHKSKHLKGQLETPASNEKVFVTNNEHFLKLCPGGQLGPHISDEKVSLTKNEHFQLSPGPTIPS